MLIIRKRGYARAGLLGNQSDGYHGKTISFIYGLFNHIERFTKRCTRLCLNTELFCRAAKLCRIMTGDAWNRYKDRLPTPFFEQVSNKLKRFERFDICR